MLLQIPFLSMFDTQGVSGIVLGNQPYPSHQNGGKKTDIYTGQIAATFIINMINMSSFSLDHMMMFIMVIISVQY